MYNLIENIRANSMFFQEKDVTSDEENNLKSLIHRHLSVRIDKIEKLQNPYLWAAFKLKQCELNSNNVLQLIHSTAACNVKSIKQNNLDWRRVCRAKYGYGVSFSKNSDYANYHSSFTGGDNRVFIICDVIANNVLRVTDNKSFAPSRDFDAYQSINGYDDISQLSNMKVLYLHNNLLETVSNLSGLRNLTYLYLQWNRISSIDSLNNLSNLTNIYLGYNSIEILKGLKGMPQLKVLHIQRQKLLPNNVNLTFDPETISELSKSLLEINVSDNNIKSINELRSLHNVIHVNVSDNLINNLNDVCNTIQQWKKLKKLEIKRNPLEKNKKYECEIIASAFDLENINGKQICVTTRIFLQSLKIIKLKREKRKQNERNMEFSSETRSFVHQLPLEFREIVSRSIIHNRKKPNL
ncbi:hypothetical protein PGB90_001758 [Kerria lacca]